MHNYEVKVPILGFEQIKTMTLESIDEIFFRLRNAKGETPAFTLIRPGAVRDDYIFDLNTAFARKLGLEDPKDALVLNIMVLDTPLQKSRINFAAPIIFDIKHHTMGQYIIEQENVRFGLAEPLEKFLEKSREEN